MATVVDVLDVFAPWNRDISIARNGETIRQHLDGRAGFTEFSVPTVCYLNSKELMRSDWDTINLRDTDIVAFIAHPQGLSPLTIQILIVLVAAAVFVTLSFIPPIGPAIGSTQEGDPAQTLKGHNNQIRPGDIIEVPYGRNVIYPSYAARPYNRYSDDNQFLYSLFCIGQGEYTIHDVKIGETDIASYDETIYEVYPPGATVTLFPDSVTTSVSVASLELEGPNEVTDPIVGPFQINSQVEGLTELLEVDYSFNEGLYGSNDNGTLDEITVDFLFEYREHDGAPSPTPIGGWLDLTNVAADETITRATIQPIRKTLSKVVSSGYYEVRARRVNNANLLHTIGDTLRWDSLRAFHPNVQDYGDVTLIAVKARATNNLNNQSRHKFNVSCTRKLEIYNGSTWSALTETRSMIWAFCDVLRSEYGAEVLDSVIDLDGLLSLDTAGRTFDWVFSESANTWDVLKTIARSNRGTPIMNGSQVSMVIDQSGSVALAVFNHENIIQGSFGIQIQLYTDDEYDGVELEYVDPLTGLKETHDYVLPELAGATNRLQKITLPGIDTDTKAFREASYIVRSRHFLREELTLSTGLEGLIPQFGDLIRVAHDLKNTVGGTVTNIALVGPIYEITLNKVVEFATGTNFIAFRDNIGGMNGPHIATATTDPLVIEVTGSLDISDLNQDPNSEPAYFIFGVGDDYGTLCKVRSIRPSGNEAVEIIAVVYSDEPYLEDGNSPSTDTQPVMVAIPDLPVVTGLLVRDYPTKTNRAIATWEPAAGANEYIIDESLDGTNFQNVGRTQDKFFDWEITDGLRYVRVAGINLGQGPFATWNGTIGGSNNLNPITDIPPDIDMEDLADA